MGDTHAYEERSKEIQRCAIEQRKQSQGKKDQPH